MPWSIFRTVLCGTRLPETGQSNSVSHISIAVMKCEDQKPGMEKGVSQLLVLDSRSVIADAVQQQAWWRTQEAESELQGKSTLQRSHSFPNSTPSWGPTAQICEPMETFLIQTPVHSPTGHTQTRAEMSVGRKLSIFLV